MFDVVDTRSLGLQRADDEEIVDVAAEENRTIVSADTDFGTILATRQAQKPSFVLLRRTQGLSPETIAAVLASNLPACAVELHEGAVVVISDEVVRVRSLPIALSTPSS
ncbi:DUF5615 family PIN-like protein [Aeromicrobium piscarium]|uniref:DUF5615 domain-containing protein n=1 Tax=Aeromicrobium piscarium TaxID=2590901 RepID=A0A554RP48_9ACTN|nr:DUF5615 family PIN-like protein [Aeromicrobium piscarium]TSD55812.1 hypothetical protein FNM00_16250 [Aeromicrobium piscarium]